MLYINALYSGKILWIELLSINNTFHSKMTEAPSIKVGDVPILFRPLKHPELGVFGYDGPEPSMTLLPVGHRRRDGVKAFEVETVWEKDVEIRMRDNVILRADIFRPAASDSTPVPAILPWSPYGKTGRGEYGGHSKGLPHSHFC
jgi:hypothetical protein